MNTKRRKLFRKEEIKLIENAMKSIEHTNPEAFRDTDNPVAAMVAKHNAGIRMPKKSYEILKPFFEAWEERTIKLRHPFTHEELELTTDGYKFLISESRCGDDYVYITFSDADYHQAIQHKLDELQTMISVISFLNFSGQEADT